MFAKGFDKVANSSFQMKHSNNVRKQRVAQMAGKVKASVAPKAPVSVKSKYLKAKYVVPGAILAGGAVYGMKKILDKKQEK